MALGREDITAALAKMRGVHRVEWFGEISVVIFLTNGLIVDALFDTHTGCKIQQVRGFTSEWMRPTDVLAQVNALGKVTMP